MSEDRFGLAITTASPAAAEAYREGVELLLAAWPGAAPAFERAIAADAGFAIAHAGLARAHQVFGRAVEARAAAASALARVATANERERRHVEILAAVIEGRSAAALAGGLAHLDAHPRDALVLSLLLGAFGLIAFSGRADHDRARAELCERLAPRYGDDWWFLGFRGWAQTEAGNLAAGSRHTERALELRRNNANAAHAMAHSLVERGAGSEAIAFLETWMPGYGRAGLLHAHLTWHLAIAALDAGDAARAVRHFEEGIRAPVSLAPPINVFTDSVSLLWRLGLAGHAQDDATWREALAYGERAFPKAGVAFIDVHFALAAAASREGQAFERRMAELGAVEAEGRLAAGAVVASLCRGFRAFADGDHAQAGDLLEAALADSVRIGGSHAQREIVEDTVIVAHLRAGRPERARRLVAARLAHRPAARDRVWLVQTASA